MLTILLTRHGHTNRSEPEQYLGQRVEAQLSRRGRRDARRLAARLTDVPIVRIIASPAARAADTARILARPHGLPVEIDHRLVELDYGAWEGLTIDEINHRFPGEFEQYDADPGTYQVGGGESGEEVAARLQPVIDELIAWSDDGSEERICLLVGHSSTNRLLLAMLLDVRLNDYRRRFDQDWVNLTVLRRNDRESGFRLLLSNDQAHSRGIRGVTWG